MANSETVAALSAYLKAIAELHKPDDWLDLRRRSMWHMHKVLAGHSIYSVAARELIRLICDGALHPQTREPLSHDRVRHLLKHTLEFLSWLDTNRRSKRMTISWDDRQNWHAWSNAANTARLGAPEPGASFRPAGSTFNSPGTWALTSLGQLTQSLSFGALPNRGLGTPPFALSASASSGLPVTFESLTPTVCTVDGSSVTLESAGTCTIRAMQGGAASYAAASALDRSFVVMRVIHLPLVRRT